MKSTEATDVSENRSQPPVLELALPPREQIGPYLILGVGKSADSEQIDAAWAKRIIWARKRQISTTLQDINWARETLKDPERRLQAEVASLNPDTADGMLAEIERGYASLEGQQLVQPIDEEKDLSSYRPAVEFPTPEEVVATTQVPEIPREFPIALEMLKELAAIESDPWQSAEIDREDLA